MTYELTIEGLAADIASATVEPKHAALLRAIRKHSELVDARLATHRGDAYLSRRSVLDAAGAVVAEDHEAWLASELQRDGGHAPKTKARLRELGYQLTECAIATLYIVHDRGGRQDNFVQLEVNVEEEFVDRRLFAANDWMRRRLEDLSDMVRDAEDGERLDAAARPRHRPPAYRLRRVFDAGEFLREAAVHERAKHKAAGERILMVSSDGVPARRVAAKDLVKVPGEYAWPGQRLIDDWTLSSAGRSGNRFSASWALQIADYTSPKGERSMSVIPLWTHTRKMAEIARHPASTYELYGKLESMDRRLDVPFAWYFYMLHGNLVHDWAGRSVLKGAEEGKIVLPEHDYRVLKNWSTWEYGF